MKTIKYILPFVFIFALSYVLVISNSCKRPKPPKATITVVDEADQPVENAKIIVLPPEGGLLIYLTSGEKFSDTTLSNAAGQASYEFKYEAIYSVKVQKTKDRVVNYDRVGTGVLILKEDETTNETIKIRVGSIN